MTGLATYSDARIDAAALTARRHDLLPVPSRPAAAPPRRADSGEPVVVACSSAMQRVLGRVRRIAPAELATVVCGPTGTGKELIASLLHHWSRRAHGPLVRFNCSAIPRDLVESELYGHVRGAFTGASASRRGYFALSDGGTLVLDEVEAFPLDAQPKLLRALENGEIQVVGAERQERVNVRVVACTNSDLASAVEAGRFRQDLYFRLAMVNIGIPPLRDRPDDIIPLFEHFLAGHHTNRVGPPLHVSSDLLEVLPALPWPGNARQLRNAVAAMVALTEDGRLDATLLACALGPGHDSPTVPMGAQPRGWLKAKVAFYERALVEQTLVACAYNCAKTARNLGICRTTLIDLIRRRGIPMVPLVNGYASFEPEQTKAGAYADDEPWRAHRGVHDTRTVGRHGGRT